MLIDIALVYKTWLKTTETNCYTSILGYIRNAQRYYEVAIAGL